MNKIWLAIAVVIIIAVAYFLGSLKHRVTKVEQHPLDAVKGDKEYIEREAEKAMDDANIADRKAELEKAKVTDGDDKLDRLADMVNRKDQP